MIDIGKDHLQTAVVDTILHLNRAGVELRNSYGVHIELPEFIEFEVRGVIVGEETIIQECSVADQGAGTDSKTTVDNSTVDDTGYSSTAGGTRAKQDGENNKTEKWTIVPQSYSQSESG